ncbi:MAG: ATP-dependent DNA helicase UvrD/PcrA, partial [uncultured Solirubrobacteraceae bacterium]
PGRLPSPGQALPGRPRGGHEALHPRRRPQPDLRREEQAARRGRLPPARRRLLRADRRGRLPVLRVRDAPHERDGLRRPARPHGERPRALPRGPRPLRRHLPPRPRGRVPGHEPRPVPLPAAPGGWGGRPPQPRGGGGPGPVGLLLPRRGHPQHPRVPGRVRGRADHPPGAELPLDPDGPGHGQRAHRPQPRPAGEAPVDRPRPGRPRQGPRARRRARGGPLRRRGDRADGRRGRVALGDRLLLPDERPVPGARGHARAPRGRLPGHRRHEVLRAGGDQGRDLLPDDPRQPAGRRLLHPGVELPAPRDRADVALPRHLARRDDGDLRVGGGGRPAGRARPRDRGVQGARAVHGHDGVPARAGGAGGARRGRPGGRPARDGLPGVARGRAHHRGAGADREPAGAHRGGAGVRRRGRAARGHAGRLPAAGRARGRRGHPPRRRGPRDPHDAPQRQGPGVPHRLHHRLRGGRLPALALARRGDAGGGAPAHVRRDHPRDARPDPDLRPPARGLRRGAELRPALPVPGRAAARPHRPRGLRGDDVEQRVRVGRHAAPAAHLVGRLEHERRPGRRGRGRRRVGAVPHRRRRGPRGVRRRRGPRHGARRDRRGPLRPGRHGAQAHGRVRPDPEAL